MGGSEEGQHEREVRDLQNLEHFLFTVDSPEASPWVLKRKRDLIEAYKDAKASKGEPVDNAAAEDAFNLWAAGLRLRIRAGGSPAFRDK